MVVGQHGVHITEPPAGAGEVHRQQLLLAAHAQPPLEAADGEKGIAAPNAPQARKPSTGGPGRSGAAGSGLRAISALTGSGRSSSPTTTRAASSASRGWASIRSAARASAPGAHQESSSANAT
jgi:hypothetical protein